MNERGKDLFVELLELPATERESFLRTACGDDLALRRELAALLSAHDAAGDFLAHPASLVADAVLGAGEDDDDELVPGDTVGNYALIERLGRGGAGVVWRARQQAPVVRDVALKLLRRGHDSGDSATRFQLEWQLLARMQHPGVAQVFEAGVLADGRPWCAMELVEGAPLTEHALVTGLATRDRMRLFVDVCRAVQHAHQKGIVHRDLKPSNVLVTVRDGSLRPVVIDFGIAAANDLAAASAGDPGTMLGTPEYMSPEQAAADPLAVDVRTDVYALGVLLYELACGERPHRRPPGPDGGSRLLHEIQVAIPAPPSRRTEQRLPHDLDHVVACAMAKDPARRYPSAAALADDVLRVLAHQPIAAMPTSRSQRLSLFLRRHRLGAAAGLAIAFALGLGLVVAAVGYREARRAESAARADQQRAESAAASARAERDRAQRESQKANRALELLDELWSNIDLARVSRSDYPVHELLRDFERTVTQAASGEPELELRLRRSLAWLHHMTGKRELADHHAERTIELARATGDTASEVHALALRAMVHMESDQAVADRDIGAALLLASPERGVGAAMCAMVLELHAQSLLRADRHADALAAAEAALRRRQEAAEPRGVAHALLTSARIRMGIGGPGDHDLAMSCAQEALTLLAPFGEREPDAVCGVLLMAVLQKRRGDLDAAEASFRDGLQRQRALYGDAHWSVASTSSEIGWLLVARGLHDEAEAMLRAALPVLRRDLGEQSPRVSELLLRLGAVAAKRGDLAAAEDLLASAAERFATLPGHAGEGQVSCLGHLACVQWQRGRRDIARATQQRAVERARQCLPETHEAASVSLTNLAGMLAALGERAAAEALLVEALGRAERSGRVDEAAFQRRRLESLRGELPAPATDGR